MTDEITPQTQKKDDKKQQPSNGAAQQQGGNRQGPKKNGPGARSTSISAGAGNPRPSSRGSNRSTSRKGPNPGNPQSAADSGSESVKKSNSGEGRQRGKSQSGGQRGGHRKASQSTSQGNRPGGNNKPKNQSGTSPAPLASNESSDALSSLQRVIADLKTTSPPTQSANAQQALAAGSTLPANAPVFQPGAAAFPSMNISDQPPRHRKAASLGASALTNPMGYSPHLGSMMEDAEDAGTPIVEDGEIPDNPYQTAHQRRSLSQSFNPPRFQALAAQQQQEQSDVVGPTGRPQLAPNFMFGARRRPSTNLSMGPPINEEDAGFQFPQQAQNSNFGDLDRKQDERGDMNGMHGMLAEQVRSLYACANTPIPIALSACSWPSRARSKPCSNSSKLSINNSSPRIRCSPSKRRALRLVAERTAVSTAPSR